MMIIGLWMEAQLANGLSASPQSLSHQATIILLLNACDLTWHAHGFVLDPSKIALSQSVTCHEHQLVILQTAEGGGGRSYMPLTETMRTKRSCVIPWVTMKPPLDSASSSAFRAGLQRLIGRSSQFLVVALNMASYKLQNWHSLARPWLLRPH
jgi:hypothetical protein